MSTVQLRYDPFDAEVQDNPYPIYRQLRNEAPVYRAADSNTWVLSLNPWIDDFGWSSGGFG